MNNIRLSVDSAERISQGWICYCINPECERIVTVDELLNHLDADRYGAIPCVFNAGEIDERVYSISIDDWEAESSGDKLEWALGAIINRREKRTEYAPAKPLPGAHGLNTFGALKSILSSQNAA